MVVFKTCFQTSYFSRSVFVPGSEDRNFEGFFKNLWYFNLSKFYFAIITGEVKATWATLYSDFDENNGLTTETAEEMKQKKAVELLE